MEGPTKVQCEKDTSLPEKNTKRRIKTPSQLQALEEFYNEHNYPTESMKAKLAENIGLTEKQVSGWFCHRRLKDKRVTSGKINPPGKQDLSSGVIQDRGSGLKQDSCSSTKQGDKLAELREVESQRYCHNVLPIAEINYEQRVLDDDMGMDDTSSESNLALRENLYPHIKNASVVETTEYRIPNGFAAQNMRRVGPSGYLKIKGRTENVAITTVKRQLGWKYREDGPPLGIEFDPLPPGAFESPINNVSADAYGDQEPIGFSSLDFDVYHKRPSLNTAKYNAKLLTQNQDRYVAPADYRSLHNTDLGSFSYRQPKQKPPFPTHGHHFQPQKSSSCARPYSARVTSDYDDSVNHSILQKHDLSITSPDLYGGKVASNPEEPLWHNYDNGSSMAIRRREKYESMGAASLVKHNDVLKKERMLPSRTVQGGKKGREEFLQENYSIRPSFQEWHQRPRQIRRSSELPSSFSEDETAVTSSSVE